MRKKPTSIALVALLAALGHMPTASAQESPPAEASPSWEQWQSPEPGRSLPRPWYERGARLIQSEGRWPHVVVGATASYQWVMGDPWFAGDLTPPTKAAARQIAAVVGYDASHLGLNLRWTWTDVRGEWQAENWKPVSERVGLQGPELAFKHFRPLWVGINLAVEGFAGYHNARNSLRSGGLSEPTRLDVSAWGAVYGGRISLELPDLYMLATGRQEITGLNRGIVHGLLGPDVGAEVRVLEPSAALPNRLILVGLSAQWGVF